MRYAQICKNLRLPHKLSNHPQPCHLSEVRPQAQFDSQEMKYQVSLPEQILHFGSTYCPPLVQHKGVWIQRSLTHRALLDFKLISKMRLRRSEEK